MVLNCSVFAEAYKAGIKEWLFWEMGIDLYPFRCYGFRFRADLVGRKPSVVAEGINAVYPSRLSTAI